MVTIDLNQFHLDQVFQQVTAIMVALAAIIAGLLALDNAVDMIAKMLGNKEIDTLCGRLAVFLNNLYNKVKPITPPVGVPPVIPASALATVPPTGASGVTTVVLAPSTGTSTGVVS